MKNSDFTPWILTDNGHGDSVITKISGENIAADFSEENYGCVVFERKVKNIKPNYYYRVESNIKNNNLTVKTIVGFINNEGVEINKVYAEENKSMLSCENASSALITVMVWGKNGGNFSLESLTLKEEGEYIPKKVVLASVGVPYNRTVRTPEWNMEQTIKSIDRLCEKNKPDIIVLTEHFYDRWTGLQIPLELDSKPIKLLCEKAREYSTYLVFSQRLIRDKKLTNTGFLINRKGEIEGLYDKCHITMGERLSGVEPGNEFKVFDTDIGRLAIAICWDMFFPEMISELRKNKVDIICHPTAGYLERRISERAYESGAYIISSAVENLSDSAIFNPLGEKIADASENNGFAVCEVDINKPCYTYWLSYPADTLSGNIFENERRGELYINE